MEHEERPSLAARRRFVSDAEREQLAESRAADLLSDATDAAESALEDLLSNLRSIEAALGVTAEEAGYERSTLLLEAMLAALARQYPEMRFHYDFTAAAPVEEAAR